MVELKKSLQGSTLIESIVALVLISLCVGIATTVFVNIVEHHGMKKSVYAMMILNELAYRERTSECKQRATMKLGNITVTCSSEQYLNLPNLKLIHFTATDADMRILAERNDIVINQ